MDREWAPDVPPNRPEPRRRLADLLAVPLAKQAKKRKRKR